ncbi:hypothetical protein PG999_003456 [Apiospora kogelbergensis]|uniref:Uncharacterized protein n=1 Tax=Apiospora kogelbergensis TaxID=1337665 RepID=A0AAW0R3L9_9PEZI
MKVPSFRRPYALRPAGLTRCLQQLRSPETSIPSIQRHVISSSESIRSLSSTAAPRQDKSRRIAIPRRRTAASLDIPHFTEEDIPSEKMLKDMLAHPATPAYLSGMTARQCHAQLHAYVVLTLMSQNPAQDSNAPALALPGGGPAECFGRSSSAAKIPTSDMSWRDDDFADRMPALYATLHSIAGMLVQGPPGPVYNLALHILHALCKVDYALSVVTVARLALMSRKMNEPHWAPSVERFERLVKSLTGYRTSSKAKTGVEAEEEALLRANAFTLKGLIIAASNKERPKPSPENYREALKYFEAALGGSGPAAKSRNSSGSAPALSFDWETPCIVEMGHCYAAIGNEKKAHAAWKFAAEELDDKDATALYAVHALRRDDPAREALLLKAAASHSKLAVDGLNRMYSERQQEKGDQEVGRQGEGGWDILFKKVIRDEWDKLASPSTTADHR